MGLQRTPVPRDMLSRAELMWRGGVSKAGRGGGKVRRGGKGLEEGRGEEEGVEEEKVGKRGEAE